MPGHRAAVASDPSAVQGGLTGVAEREKFSIQDPGNALVAGSIRFLREHEAVGPLQPGRDHPHVDQTPEEGGVHAVDLPLPQRPGRRRLRDPAPAQRVLRARDLAVCPAKLRGERIVPRVGLHVQDEPAPHGNVAPHAGPEAPLADPLQRAPVGYRVHPDRPGAGQPGIHRPVGIDDYRELASHHRADPRLGQGGIREEHGRAVQSASSV